MDSFIWFFMVFQFLLGSAVGSFLYLAATRWTNDRQWRSLVHPPSHCDSCGTILKAYHLIPVFSFLWLRGKCRSCGQLIPRASLYAEVITGTLYAIAFIAFPFEQEWVVASLLFTLLSFFTWTDVQFRVIPNPVVYAGIVLAIFIRFWTHPLPYLDYLIGGVIGFALLLLIAYVSRGGMGGGDIKLFSFIGLMIGWKGVVLALILSSAAGSIYGIYKIRKVGYSKRMEIPFAPSILVGTVAAYLWAEDGIQWYMRWLVNG